MHVCCRSALGPHHTAVPKPGSKVQQTRHPGCSPQPFCVACGGTEEDKSGSSWSGLHIRWIVGLKGGPGWSGTSTSCLLFLPKPPVSSEHLTSIFQPCLAGSREIIQAPYGARICFFFRVFPVELAMKSKTPRHSWSSLQWLKLHYAHSKWHVSMTARLWTVPCSCARKKFS